MKGEIRLFLSGSSASMLSREVHTSMRGRAMEVTVFPFSFREALLHQNLLPEVGWDLLPKARRSTLENTFHTDLSEGGFPDAGKITPHFLLPRGRPRKRNRRLYGGPSPKDSPETFMTPCEKSR